MESNLAPLGVSSINIDHDDNEGTGLLGVDMAIYKRLLYGEWDEIVNLYETNYYFYKKEIKGRGTALHVAVSNGRLDIVKRLVDAILMNGDESSLSSTNEIGATPLHLAAYRGFREMCEIIIGEKGARKYLIKNQDENRETPLFWAVRARKRLVFIYLHQFFPYDINLAINKNDTTILHIAIEREMFDMATIIMYVYYKLRYIRDKNNVTPLQILATKTSAFKSGSRLLWWEEILYYCCFINTQYSTTTARLYPKLVTSKGLVINEINDHSEVPTVYDLKDLETAYKRRVLSQLDFFSCVKILHHRIQKFVFRWSILSLLDLKAIKIIKKKHICGGQLLEEFMKIPYGSYIGVEVGDIEHYDNLKQDLVDFLSGKPKRSDTSMQETNNGEKDTTFLAVAKSGIAEIIEELNSKVPVKHDKKGLLLVAMKNIKQEEEDIVNETTYLTAARHGIFEIMSELQTKIKSVISDTNSNNENALLLAVKNRHPHVVVGLEKNDTEIFRYLKVEMDINDNTMLHLAAYTSIHREHTWWISGAAMQMMWDIKWYKYIQGLVPEYFNHKRNKEGKTPSEIFKEQHNDLLEKSMTWLKETAESCSVVAALIAGVSFATSGSVPGGNQQTGEPALEGHPAFEGFAISSLIGLYFSLTALIMFLSILTSRKEIEDFRRTLPLKLLFGLSSLFVSIVSMFVSFCAGHFFVLTDKYTKGGILFYLYISICLPVTFYAIVQFPLFVDLVKVIWKKVPPPSVKGAQI